MLLFFTICNVAFKHEVSLYPSYEQTQAVRVQLKKQLDLFPPQTQLLSKF